MMFAAITVGIKLLFPQVCAWVATETNLAQVFYLWYPLAATILLLYDFWNADCNEKELRKEKRDEAGSRPKKTKNPLGEQRARSTSEGGNRLFPRTTPTASAKQKKKRRSSLVNLVRHDDDVHHNASETDATLLQERQTYWLHYWMVCSALASGKSLLSLLPFAARILKSYPTVHSIVCQIELIFWIWLNAVPSMTPSSIKRLEAYGTPVEFMALNSVIPLVTPIYQAVSSVIPATPWQTYVVDPTTKVLGVCVWSKLLTQESCDGAAHFISEGRGLVLPALTAFSWPLQAYGILYVAYALPLAKSGAVNAAAIPRPPVSSKDRFAIHWLQYWVLHCLLTSTLKIFSGIIWWIPFSNVVIFGLYSAMSVVSPANIGLFYHSWIHQELQSFHVLPLGDHQPTLPTTHEARLVRFFYWVIDKLPKAVDDVGEESEHTGGTPSSRIDGEKVGDKLPEAVDEIDDEKKESEHSGELSRMYGDEGGDAVCANKSGVGHDLGPVDEKENDNINPLPKSK